jgi:hypothetical protein
MTNSNRLKAYAAAFALFATISAVAYAQTGASTDSLATQLSQALGSPPTSVEVSRTTNVLTIMRINTPMNGSTHANRNAEAGRIATAISESMKNLPDSAKILAINVDYVERPEKSGRDKLVDRIEMRKNAKGLFETHIS